MAGENGHLERPASPQEIEEALARIYTGKVNVALQAADLGITLERLKQLFREYVAARPIDINDEDTWLGDTTMCWPYA
jgi:succinate dehydrogenase/fumarate reductase flavoprotein subunit